MKLLYRLWYLYSLVEHTASFCIFLLVSNLKTSPCLQVELQLCLLRSINSSAGNINAQVSFTPPRFHSICPANFIFFLVFKHLNHKFIDKSFIVIIVVRSGVFNPNHWENWIYALEFNVKNYHVVCNIVIKVDKINEFIHH